VTLELRDASATPWQCMAAALCCKGARLELASCDNWAFCIYLHSPFFFFLSLIYLAIR